MSDPISSITSSLKASQIIPDMIPSSDWTPTVLFSVIFKGGQAVVLGNELTVEDAADEPDIDFTPLTLSPFADGNKSYTLAMTDYDAPSRTDHQFGEYRHWVVSLESNEKSSNNKM
jgi:phosphatidylethanolamine-binding protein